MGNSQEYIYIYILNIWKNEKCSKPPTRKWGNSWLVAWLNTCATCRDSPVERTPNWVPRYQTVTFCGIISKCSFLRGYSDSPVLPNHSPRFSDSYWPFTQIFQFFFSWIKLNHWNPQIFSHFPRKSWKLPHLQNAKFQGHVCEVRGLHSGLDEVAANCGWTTLLYVIFSMDFVATLW